MGSPFKKKDVVQTTVAEHVDGHMRAIKAAFADGSHLTLVVRDPTMQTPIIFTNDNPEAIIDAVRQMGPGKSGLILNS